MPIHSEKFNSTLLEWTDWKWQPNGDETDLKPSKTNSINTINLDSL